MLSAEEPSEALATTTPRRPADFQISEQVLRTPSGELQGRLILPSKNIQAWSLIVAGSGATDRDGNSAGTQSNCLLYLATELAARGIASLSYDKSGVAGSAAAGPVESALTFEHYVEDAKRWLAALRLKATGPVAIVGHSEGAQIAARVAEKLSVSAVVNLCGSGRALDQLLREQLARKLPAELMSQVDEILGYLHDLSVDENLRAERPKSFLRRQGSRAKAPEIPPLLSSVFRPSVHPFLVSRMRERPDLEFGHLRCPALLVSGSADEQVSLEDAQRLANANPDAQSLRIDGMNHVLKQVGDDRRLQSLSYRDNAMPLAAGLSEAIADFLINPRASLSK